MVMVEASSYLHFNKEGLTMATSSDRLQWSWFTRTGQRGGQQHYRWSVKTASDPEANQIQATSPTKISITDLIAEPVPPALVGVDGRPPGPGRTEGVETTVYALDAWLLRCHPETDGDYHLVLGDDAGNTMIAEIPDPGRVDPGSPFFAQIKNARAAFEARYPEITNLAQVHGVRGRPALVEINERAHLTGIGFFDFVHGQDGVAGNGIELHPVLDIAFP